LIKLSAFAAADKEKNGGNISSLEILGTGRSCYMEVAGETRTGLDVSDLILIFEKAHGEELSEGRLLLG